VLFDTLLHQEISLTGEYVVSVRAIKMQCMKVQVLI